MDAYLAIVSKRDHRDFAPRTVPPDTLTRILQAGRLSGSGMNRQRWRFHVLADEGRRADLAAATWSPQNLVGAPLVIAVVIWGGGLAPFDAGRAAQSMMLAAWAEGVASCPNGFSDPQRAAAALALGEGETPLVALAFGFPRTPRDPARRSPERWIAGARRRPLDEVARTED